VIAAISLGVLGVVFVVAAWSRFGRGLSQRRSVEEHQHALDVLGEVAKRRDGIAPVRAPSPQEIGRAHVQPTEEAEPRYRRREAEIPPGSRPPARLVLRSSPKPLKLPIFDDVARRREDERPLTEVSLETGVPTFAPVEHLVPDDLAHFDDSNAMAGAPPAGDRLLRVDESADEVLRGPGGAHPSTSLAPPKPLRSASQGNPFILRRIAAVAAILIVLAAVGVGSWQLASSGSPGGGAAASPPAKPHGSHHASHQHTGSSRSPTVVHEIVPTSTTQNIVTFPLSASSFTITFSSTAPCWIGILPSQHGQYVWMTTVEAGTMTTYHASAPVYVRIGAPQYLVVRVNGVRLALPPKKIQPYDVTFTVGSSISA
jgi:Domain of unknown function (DUF4115)